MRALVGAFVLALSGCALLQPGADDIVAADNVVEEALEAAQAPSAAQKRALARAQQAYARQADTQNRFRLGVLLATLPAPLGDDARARELLEPLADASAPGNGRMAALLTGQLAERQRLAREMDRAGREAERAARERHNAEKERDKREELLRQQLEALRAIERGILEREEKLRRRQR
jgi:hypothetical protein